MEQRNATRLRAHEILLKTGGLGHNLSMPGASTDPRNPTTNHVSTELVELVDSLEPGSSGFVGAPAGSGKTTLLRAWRHRLTDRGIPVAWVSLTPAHSDPALLIEEWVSAIRDSGATCQDKTPFGQVLLQTLTVLGDQDPAAWALHADRALRLLDDTICILFDNLHLVEGRGLAIIEQLHRIEREGTPIIIVASRGSRPAATTRALGAGTSFEVNAHSLALDASQTQAIARSLDCELDASETERVLSVTGGWATGVVLAIRQLASSPNVEREALLANLSSAPDLFDYLAHEVVATESDAMLDLLNAASILGPIAPSLLITATAAKSEMVDAALRRGILMSSDGNVFVHHLWEAFFRDRMQQNLDDAGRREFLERMGRVLAESDPARAIPVLAEAQAGGALAEILRTEGVDWWERGYRDLLDRALEAITQKDVDANPRLELVAALQLSATDPSACLARLADVADALRAAGDRPGEDIAIHRGIIIAGNASRHKWLAVFVRRLVSLRRLASDPAARAMGRLGLALGAFFTERYRMGERLIKGIDRSLFPGEAEQAAPVFALSQFHRHFGTWTAGLTVFDEALEGSLPVVYPPAREMIVMYRAFILGLRRAANAPPDKAGSGSVADALAVLRDSRDALRSFGLSLSDEQASIALVQLTAEAGREDDALEELDRSFSGVSEHRAWVGQVHAEVIRAGILMRKGQRDAALDVARGALVAFESKSRKALKSSPMTWVAAVAAWTVAEAGDLPRAQAFLRTHASTVRGVNSPLIRHASHICQARIASLGKDEGLTSKNLKAAWAAARSGPIIDAAPEIRGELLVWAMRESKRLGIDVIDEMWETSVAKSGNTLAIETLGELSVEIAGEKIPTRDWRGKTSRRLLIRLLLAGTPGLTRERVQDDLWPELAPDKAANNLRVTLTRLRSALGRLDNDEDGDVRNVGNVGGDFSIAAEDGRITLGPSYFKAWDVTAFKDALRLAEAGVEEALDRAIGLYKGPFLPEYFDDWVGETRIELETRIIRVGTRFVEAHQKRDDARRAGELARNLLRIDSANESLWVAVASADLALDDRTAALRTIAEARTTLQRELDVDSSPDLDTLENRARLA